MDGKYRSGAINWSDAGVARLAAVTLVAALILSPAVVIRAQVNNYIVGPQDVLTIALYDQPDLSGKYTVEADGTFTFPLIGRVTAGGLTLRDVEQELREAAGRRLLQEPAGDRGGGAVPQSARLRDGRGAHAGAVPADRRHDAHRGARPRRFDAPSTRPARR